jgi:GDP-L-fucose synthase
MNLQNNISKILITGGSGMVGKNFLEHNDIKKYSILAPNRSEVDLLNFKQVSNYIKKNKPDLIIHAAGKVGGILANIKSPVTFLNNNADIGKNILLAAREHNIKKLINLSSSCVYPKNLNRPLEESDILKGELEPTNEAYAIGKIYTQKLCQYINKENNQFSYNTLIPCNLFGRHDNFDLETGHLLPNIISKIYIAKQKKKKDIFIWGDGSSRREFMYTGDFIDFLFFAIKKFNNLPLVLNVGLGHDFSVLDYYKAVAEVFLWDGNFKFDLSKPVGQKQKLVSVKNLNEFGWKNKTSLKKGIKETINFFLERNKNVI